MFFQITGCINWSKVGDGYQIWYAALGALIGAAIALFVDQLVRAIQTRKERESATKALAERLTFNNDRALQMLGQFAGGTEIPNYPLDTTGIIIWLSLSSAVLDDDLIKDINWHRYQLDHINRKMLVYSLFTSIGPTSPNAVESYVAKEQEHRQSICKHLETVTKDICILLGRVEKAR